MSSPLRLWLAANHHKAFLNGGWAFVRVQVTGGAGAERSGVAGGDRRTNRLAMLVAGLVDALKDQPPAETLLHLSAADAVLLAPLTGGEPPKDVDLAAYAPAVAALKGRPLKLVRVAEGAGTPLAFAQAWADLAADKAKATGAFRSPIPKPNLAKVGGL